MAIVDCTSPDISRFEVLTPYSHTLIDTTLSSNTEEADYNYTPYDLFCLQTQLSPYLLKEFKLTEKQLKTLRETRPLLVPPDSGYYTDQLGLSIRFINKYLYGKMVVTIEIYSGTDRIELTPEQCQKLQTKVNDILANTKNYALVLTANIPLDYTKDEKRRSYPQVWVRSIMRYLNLTEETMKMNSFIQEGSLYVQFIPGPTSYSLPAEPVFFESLGPGYREYYRQYNDLCRSLMDQLEFYYNNGVIVTTKTFAEKWQLEAIQSLPVTMASVMGEDSADGRWIPDTRLLIEYSDTTGLSGSLSWTDIIQEVNYKRKEMMTAKTETDETGLYMARWRDHRFCDNIVDFLLDRMNSSEPISIDVSDNFVIRHHIAKNFFYLRNQQIKFSGKNILIPGDDLNEIRQMVTVIYRSIRTASGRVLPLKVSSPEMIKALQQATIELIQSEKSIEERTTSYLIDNQELIYSTEVPLNENLIELSDKLYSRALNYLKKKQIT